MTGRPEERRESQRVSLHVPLLFEKGGRSFWSMTEDVSLGGAFLQSFHPPETGERLDVRFHPPVSSRDLRLQVKVVHRRERNKSAFPDEAPSLPAGVGVVFEGVSRDLRDRLADVLFGSTGLAGRKRPGALTGEADETEPLRLLKDPDAIQRVFQCVCRKLVPVHVRHLGGTIAHVSYFTKIESSKRGVRVLAEPIPLQDADPAVRSKVPFLFQFPHQDRWFSFTVKEAPEEVKRPWSFRLPVQLTWREDRRQERYSHELKHPVTVEFPDPFDSNLHRVKNVLDVSFGGLAFKSYPGEEVYPPGTPLEGLTIFASDRFCRATEGVVKHSGLACSHQGEVFRRVGVAFSDRGAPRLTEVPRFKEDEMEEMTRPETILQHLKRVSQSSTKILSGLDHCILFSDGVLRAEKRSEGTEILVTSPHLARSPVGLFQEGDVTYHYLLHGTYHFFVAPTHREDGALKLQMPSRIYKAKRRRVVRVDCNEGRAARLRFVHPVLGHRLTFPLRDLSVRGLAFDCDYTRHLLWKEFFLKDSEIELEGEVHPVGSVEVRSLSLRAAEGGIQEKTCGAEFFDLPCDTEKKISDYIFRKSNPHIVQVASEKIENLWQLFSKSGFLYPSKAAYLSRIKGEVNETWKTLLSGDHDFYKHIVFREGEEELGTASAVQVYENCWLFQHLATTSHPVKLVAKYVILGLAQFLMEHREIKYLITYFRKENSFPRKIYSGFLDSYPLDEQLRFTKFNFLSCDLGGESKEIPPVRLPMRPGRNGILIELAGESDKEIIESCLRKELHPLLIRSRSLHRDSLTLPETSAVFRPKGLFRDRYCLVARDRGELAAFALVENASPGMNLSGLLNTFCVWSMQSDRRSHEIKRILIRAVAGFYRSLGVRTAICLTLEEDPGDYAAVGFRKEKEYICFTSSRKAIKSYYDYVQERFSRFEERKHRSSGELLA
ncbi:MAG: PilZ domain-containing protein [bacterium]